MKVIKIDLPSELTEIELHTFADEHIGDELCDMKRLQERIEYVKNTPHAYCILNGDIMDNATKTSVGDVYTQVLSPMDQLKTAVELFEPIKDKILCISHGNHENRTYKGDGINLTAILAEQLGLTDKYSPISAVIFLRFGKLPSHSHGRKVLYTLFVTHGNRSGRGVGSKAKILADMAATIDADIYIHSHTHVGLITKRGYFRTTQQNSSVAFVVKLFVNTAANLNYGGYGEAAEFEPSSKDTPVIYLCGTSKRYEAKL